MALAYEGMAFLKAAIEVVPGEKQPLPVLFSRKQPGGFSENRIREDDPHSAKADAGTGMQTGESGLVHPRLKPVQLSSQQTGPKRPSDAPTDPPLEFSSVSSGKDGPLGIMDRTASAGFDGSDFESCAGSPQAAASWCSALEEAGDTPWAKDTPRSMSRSSSSERERQIGNTASWRPSVEKAGDTPWAGDTPGLTDSSERGRQIESLEVQLASKSREIQRLADVCSGAELALAEREKEANHLGALAKNLEDQIEAKNEVLNLSQELIGSLEERLVALEVQRGALEARAGEYEECLLEVHGELEAGRKELEGVRREKESAVKRSQELGALVESLEGQMREEKQKCAALEARLREADRVAAARVGALTEKITRLQTGLADNARALRSAEELIGGLKRQLQEKEDACRESRAQCERVLREGSAQCERALQAQAEIVRAAEARVKGLENDVARKDGNLEAVGAHVADLTRQLAEQEEEREKAQAGVKRLQGQLVDARADNERLREALEEESRERRALEGELEASRLDLGDKEALIAKLRAQLADALERGERERSGDKRPGIQLVTSPESSWGDVGAASANTVALCAEHLEDTGSSQVGTSDAESVADAGESTVGELLPEDGEEKQEGGFAEPSSNSSALTQLAFKQGGCGAFSGSHVAVASEAVPCHAGSARRVASKGNFLESAAPGLLKRLVNVVSRRCSKDIESVATAPRGLKALLIN